MGLLFTPMMGSIVVDREVVAHGFFCVNVIGIDLLSGLGAILFIYFFGGGCYS